MIVEDLKKSFLQQAFEGKLTHSLENDTLVEESLKKITVQKNFLIESYNVRNEPEYKEVIESEYLFSIPETWKWIRIGQLGVFKKGPFGSALTKGMFVKESDNTVKVYEQKNAIQKDIDLGDYYISNKYFEEKMKSFEIKEGDIIVSCAGTIGETYIIPKEHKRGIINQALMRMTMVDELNVNYFLQYFDYILKRISNNLSSGSAIKNIPPFDVFKQLLIPLPPIEEQQRIVDKITELFLKLDEVKPIEEELLCLKTKFPSEMKKSLYLAGFKGKLSNSLFSDTNVEQLLSKVIGDRNIDAKEIKRRKISSDFTEPYQLPETWKWIKLGYLCDVIRGLTFSSSYKEQLENTVLVLRGGNIDSKTEHLIFEDNIFVDKNIPNYNQYLSIGDTLIVASSGTKTSVGKSAYINEIGENISFGGFMMVVRPYKEIVNPKYISYQIKMYRNKIINDTNGYISNITNEILNNLLIPLPPIEEQQRIVEKLEQLIPLCNDIENQ